VWGCPTYELDPTLQDGKKLPKLEGSDQRDKGEKTLPAIEAGIAAVNNSNYNLILGICIDNKNRIHDYRDLN
ncbi:MAG: hypothetical protein ACREBR_02415, partial [bacterium]